MLKATSFMVHLEFTAAYICFICSSCHKKCRKRFGRQTCIVLSLHSILFIASLKTKKKFWQVVLQLVER